MDRCSRPNAALPNVETNANVHMRLKERRERLPASVEHELERELQEQEY